MAFAGTAQACMLTADAVPAAGEKQTAALCNTIHDAYLVPIDEIVWQLFITMNIQ